MPNGSLDEIFVQPVLNYLKLRGHKVLSGVGLGEIKIIDERVQSFVLSDDQILKADVFISALPPQRLLGVLPMAFLRSRRDLEALEDFTYSPIVSINLFFDRPVMSDVFIGASAGRVHWFFNKSPNHVMGVISAAYEELDKSKEELVQKALLDLRLIYPEVSQAKLTHSLVNIERQATLSCRVGVNAKRPDQKILENFYMLGDWTATGLPPTIEGAVVSAKKMVLQVDVK